MASDDPSSHVSTRTKQIGRTLATGIQNLEEYVVTHSDDRKNIEALERNFSAKARQLKDAVMNEVDSLQTYIYSFRASDSDGSVAVQQYGQLLEQATNDIQTIGDRIIHLFSKIRSVLTDICRKIAENAANIIGIIKNLFKTIIFPLLGFIS